MQTNPKSAAQAGLRFFGRITASTTHEMNNCLGIINENAGLLEDLALMAEGGMEVDPARWTTISGRIGSQVRRAGEIVSRLNSFAHTVDRERAETDIRLLLEMTVALCARLLARDNVRVRLEKEQETMMLSTAPFHCIHLVSRCLALAARHVAEPGREIRLSWAPGGEEGEEGVVVVFRGLDLNNGIPLAGGIEQELLAILDADLRPGARPGELLLALGAGRNKG
ncbi:MAG TPA: hypothetical protein ENI89_02235 [Desulfobulbus sp.]|nr:hypothetical protein [Desulfobulbus sp.]